MFSCVFSGPIQSPVAVKQNGPGCIREMQIVERQDKQFIPENVAAIGFSVQSSGRDTDIKVDIVRRSSDHAMILIEPEQFLRPPVSRYLNINFLPDVGPGSGAGLLHFIKPVDVLQGLSRSFQGVFNIFINGSVNGCHFINADGRAFLGF